MGDLLASLSLVQLLALEDGGVVLLEAAGGADRAEVVEEPTLQAHLVGIKILRREGRGRRKDGAEGQSTRDRTPRASGKRERGCETSGRAATRTRTRGRRARTRRLGKG